MLVLFVFFPKQSTELSSIEDTTVSGDVAFGVLIILLCLDGISLFLRLSQSAIITPIPGSVSSNSFSPFRGL